MKNWGTFLFSIGLTTVFLLTSSYREIAAESRSVDLLAELKSAHVVTRAQILAYRTDGIEFQPLPEPSRPMTAKYVDDPSWTPMGFLRDDWQKATEPSLTSEWPRLGAEVLVVVDAQNTISLFGWPIGDEYRVWSPMMTGSVALFTCDPPARPLVPPTASLGFMYDSDKNKSWDGCLIPMASVVTKGVAAAPR